MIKYIVCLITALLLTACARDESISKYANPGATYRLTELDGVAFTANATIAFPEKGRVIGQAPCNSYSASQTVPYPWFGLEGIIATRSTCPDQTLETMYFAALEGMTLVEAAGNTLILSNSSGREMVFTTP